jgi:hypothetical protein
VCDREGRGGPLDLTEDQAQEVVKLAFGAGFEPGERLIVDQPEESLRDPLLAELRAEQCRSPSRYQARSGSCEPVVIRCRTTSTAEDEMSANHIGGHSCHTSCLHSFHRSSRGDAPGLAEFRH